MKQRIGDAGPADKAPTADSVAFGGDRPDSHVESLVTPQGHSQATPERTFAKLSVAVDGGERRTVGSHTPGPWRFDPGWLNSYKQDDKAGGIISSDGWVVGEVCKDVDEWGGNARLIAAAPELLAAAKRVVELTAGHKLLQAEMDIPVLEAAIRKAEEGR